MTKNFVLNYFKDKKRYNLLKEYEVTAVNTLNNKLIKGNTLTEATIIINDFKNKVLNNIYFKKASVNIKKDCNNKDIISLIFKVSNNKGVMYVDRNNKKDGGFFKSYRIDGWVGKHYFVQSNPVYKEDAIVDFYNKYINNYIVTN